MAPGGAADDSPDGRRGHTELARQGRLRDTSRRISPADLANLLGGEPRGTITFAAVQLGVLVGATPLPARNTVRPRGCEVPTAVGVPPLRPRIGLIVGMGAKEQVGGIA